LEVGIHHVLLGFHLGADARREAADALLDDALLGYVGLVEQFEHPLQVQIALVGTAELTLECCVGSFERNERFVVCERGLATGLNGQGIAFDAFRKACGSLLLKRAGKDPRQVQRWLGHSQLTTTMNIYITDLDDGLGGADDLDGLWGHHGATEDQQTAANGSTPERQNPALEAKPWTSYESAALTAELPALGAS
jgi:hypothetical protein